MLITGCPGAGKTTVARLLAEKNAGVHLETDAFYEFVKNLIDPSTPAANQQNTAIVLAWCRAAEAYIDYGWPVYVDGIIGPRWFPTIHSIVGEFDYVLLRVSHETARARVRARTNQPTARPSVVDRMFPQFDKVSKEYPDHAIDTETMTVVEIAAQITERQRKGELRVAA